jgi:uncharacterized protein YndB with AHSA1/START domain
MPDEIEIQIEIAARPATVYKFLSDADRLREWLGDVTATPNTGGEISVRYRNGDIARGKFVELLPDRRVVFTWGYDGSANGMAPGSSTVTIELLGVETGTLLTLRHAGIPTDEARNGHAQGWKYFFTQLGGKATGAELDARIPALLDCYVRATNEPDDEARLALLERCWESDASFCDAMGRGAGREEFSRFIGNAHQMASGVRLEITGVPQRTAEFLRFEWKLFVGEHPYSTGNTFGQLSLGGRFASTVAFANPPRA